MFTELSIIIIIVKGVAVKELILTEWAMMWVSILAFLNILNY